MFDGIRSLAKLASKTREQMNAMEQLIELLTTRNDYLTRDNHDLQAERDSIKIALEKISNLAKTLKQERDNALEQVAKLNQLLSGHE
jgi:regulator of replication initiation timing